jgi:hypothetical protein
MALQELLGHYCSVKKMLSNSVNLELSNDEIYNSFRFVFDEAHKDMGYSDIVLKVIAGRQCLAEIVNRS